MAKKRFYLGIFAIIAAFWFVLSSCLSTTQNILFTGYQPVGKYKQIEIPAEVSTFQSVASSQASVLARFYRTFPSDKYIIVAIETVFQDNFKGSVYVVTYVERQ